MQNVSNTLTKQLTPFLWMTVLTSWPQMHTQQLSNLQRQRPQDAARVLRRQKLCSSAKERCDLRRTAYYSAIAPHLFFYLSIYVCVYIF